MQEVFCILAEKSSHKGKVLIKSVSKMKIIVPLESKGNRLDTFLVSYFNEHHAELCVSRTKIQNLINGGHIKMSNRHKTFTSQLIQGKESIWVTFPEAKKSDRSAEDIPLSILYEDEYMIVLDKPYGMVVHPAPGNSSGTLLNAILHHCGDSLEGIQGVKQPGIVHRLDKQTRGLMMVAKTEKAHLKLSEMLKDHVIDRRYIALVWGELKDLEGTINAPIGRSFHNRQKMAIHNKGKPSVTHYKVLDFNNKVSLIECRLDTGRTHQIRLHMTHLGHPVLGDVLYGSAPKGLSPERKKQLLEAFPPAQAHALISYSLKLIHPILNKELYFTLPVPLEFTNVLSTV
jgi:23S rRNA pseudouridine1911/1915/1917 synthase